MQLEKKQRRAEDVHTRGPSVYVENSSVLGDFSELFVVRALNKNGEMLEEAWRGRLGPFSEVNP